LDRKDVNGNYEPSNCRWVDMKAQGRNKRNNRLLEYNGEQHTLSEWSEILGVGYQTLYARITRYGWNGKDVLSRPIEMKYSHKR
jgi:transposase